MEDHGLIDIVDAIHDFHSLTLGQAAKNLLLALRYPIEGNSHPEDHSIDYFMFFVADKRAPYGPREMDCLKKIARASLLCKLSHKDLISGEPASRGAITFIAIEIHSRYRDRSEDALEAARLLLRSFNTYLAIIIKSNDAVCICAPISNESPLISDWYCETSALSEIVMFSNSSFPNVLGAKTVRELYEDLAYNISREYLIYHESYEYLAYEIIETIDFLEFNEYISKQFINANAENNGEYYRRLYGDDYINLELNQEGQNTLDDDDWLFMEMEIEEALNTQIDESTDVISESDEDTDRTLPDIDEDIMRDPELLLKWLEMNDQKMGRRL